MTEPKEGKAEAQGISNVAVSEGSTAKDSVSCPTKEESSKPFQGGDAAHDELTENGHASNGECKHSHATQTDDAHHQTDSKSPLETHSYPTAADEAIQAAHEASAENATAIPAASASATAVPAESTKSRAQSISFTNAPSSSADTQAADSDMPNSITTGKGDSTSTTTSSLTDGTNAAMPAEQSKADNEAKSKAAIDAVKLKLSEDPASVTVDEVALLGVDIVKKDGSATIQAKQLAPENENENENVAN